MCWFWASLSLLSVFYVTILPSKPNCDILFFFFFCVCVWLGYMLYSLWHGKQMISHMLSLIVLGFLDLLSTLIWMLQKLEFLYEHVAHPDVIAIFFWILDILPCTPRYIASACPLNSCNLHWLLLKIVSHCCRKLNPMNRGRVYTLGFIFLGEILLLSSQIVVLIVRTAPWLLQPIIVDLPYLLHWKILMTSALSLIGVEWQ